MGPMFAGVARLVGELGRSAVGVVHDEDAEIRARLAALGPGALTDLRRILEGSADYRHDLLVALMARPAYADLAALIVRADGDELVRLRLLRAIRDLGD